MTAARARMFIAANVPSLPQNARIRNQMDRLDRSDGRPKTLKLAGRTSRFNQHFAGRSSHASHALFVAQRRLTATIRIMTGWLM